MSARELIAHVEHFQHRVIQDAIEDATAEFWLRRANDFEDARPRPDDFNGQATPEQLRERDRRCAETAEACRGRADWSLRRTA